MNEDCTAIAVLCSGYKRIMSVTVLQSCVQVSKNSAGTATSVLCSGSENNA